MVTVTEEAAPQGVIQVVDPIKFDWIYTFFLLWFSTGLYIDARAHNLFGVELEGFFTPWHAVLYSGYGATAGTLLYYTIKKKAMGYSWTDSIPHGYFGSAIGLILFNIGGIGDVFWHELIGIEVNVDGFYSPPHMFLLTGAIMMWIGPFRASWVRLSTSFNEPREWVPSALSLGLVISLLTFFFQYAFLPVTLLGTGAEYNGVRPDNPVGNNLEGLGSAGVIISSISLAALVLMSLKRWGTLPKGYFTVVMLLYTLGLDVIFGTYYAVAVSVASGLLYDFGIPSITSRYNEVKSARIIGFMVPFIFYGLMFLWWALSPAIIIWYNLTMVTGLIYLGAMMGLVTSFLMYTPDVPSEYN
ncbi:MAG: hypothetical protein ACXAE3_14700 [Candidatus Kariarchaeaceae archaeon]|jgi:hypothetical protein